MAEFDDWAAVYDIVHAGLPGELDFYVKAASETTGNVLELGCGTGRITVPIAELGKTIVGLDISRPMLDRCMEKWTASCQVSGVSKDRLKLVQDNMSTFCLNETFSLIILPYRSFMHLLRSEEQRSCLEKIAEHLDDGGRFIMNMWVPSAAYIYAYSEKPETSEYARIDTYEETDTDHSIEHFHSVFCNEFEQRMVEEHLFVTVDKDGGEVTQKCLPLMRTWITVREMNNLIAASPLEVDAVWGDFSASPFSEGATESIWVLKKREL